MHSARRWIACLLLGLTGTAAWAGSYTQYLQDLAWRESRHRLSERAGSHIGLFQMGTAALIDAGYMNASGQWTGKNGATSAAAFLSSAAIQTQAVHDYNQVQWAWIERNHLDSYIGQTINGVEITASGLLAAAHLVGRAGLSCYLAGNYCNAAGVTLRDGVPVDGFGTPVTEYLSQFGGHDLGLDNAAAPAVAYSDDYSPGYGSLSGAGGSSGSDSEGTAVGSSGVAVYDAQEAFALGSGFSVSGLASVLGALGTAISLCLGAWMILGNLQAVANGRLRWGAFGGRLVRTLVLVTLFAWAFQT